MSCVLSSVASSRRDARWASRSGLLAPSALTLHRSRRAKSSILRKTVNASGKLLGVIMSPNIRPGARGLDKVNTRYPDSWIGVGRIGPGPETAPTPLPH